VKDYKRRRREAARRNCGRVNCAQEKKRGKDLKRIKEKKRLAYSTMAAKRLVGLEKDLEGQPGGRASGTSLSFEKDGFSNRLTSQIEESYLKPSLKKEVLEKNSRKTEIKISSPKNTDEREITSDDHMSPGEKVEE